MTAKARRQLALLLGLLVVLAAVVSVRRETAAPAGTAAGGSAPGAADASAAPESAVADLQLEALAAERQVMSPPERNPFRFEAREAPAPPGASAGASRPEPVAPAAPAGPPPPPPIPLKFIGVLEAPSRIGTVAILSDSRGNVFYGKEGAIIEGRYQVLRIGTDSAEVAYVDGRGRQTIRLSGQ